MKTVSRISRLPREKGVWAECPERSVYFNPLFKTEYFEVLIRTGDGVSSARASLPEIEAWAKETGIAAYADKILHRFARPPETFAGLSLKKPLIMGIVNATPDSFSNSGRWDTAETGMRMLYDGADLIDVGGESTRPGASCLDAEEETGRVLPVVEELLHCGAIVSVDTRKSLVTAAAVEAGAQIINDVSAFTFEPEGLEYVSRDPGVCVVLMHSQGTPEHMQDDPSYASLPSLEVFDYLADRIAVCEKSGIFRNRICIDPGIGFGKTVDDNCEILSRLGMFKGLGCPVLLGVSRKSFIAAVSKGETADKRLSGTLAASVAALDKGVDILRVHDAAETAQAVAVWQKIKEFE